MKNNHKLLIINQVESLLPENRSENPNDRSGFWELAINDGLPVNFYFAGTDADESEITPSLYHDFCSSCITWCF